MIKQEKMTFHSEHILQVQCVSWFRLAYSSKLMFAIPNGGARHVAVGAKLKKEGVLAGVPDLFIAEPNKHYNGLFIELKNGNKGRVNEKQKKLIEQLNIRGYKTSVVRYFDDFVEVVNSYFSGVIKHEVL